MFEDPRGIKYIGTPAWKTHGNYRNIARAEQGNVDAERATHPDGMQSGQEKQSQDGVQTPSHSEGGSSEKTPPS